MLITELIIIGNKRLMLNNIKEIVYKLNNPFQLIIGTNGSGKSSLLKEMSPLPPYSGDYTKDGSKTIKLEDNNNIYILTSTFKHGNKHSFVICRNGDLDNPEELNDGGTGAVQKDLVEKHFRYTSEIHELLTDEITLTGMAPQKRREWFTKLTPNNISYAINVFNSLKTRLRDSQGAFNHIGKRLTVETNKLLSLTDIDGIEGRVESLKKDILIFLENKDPTIQNIHVDEEELLGKLKTIKTMSTYILNMPLSPLMNKFNSLEEILNYCNDLETKFQNTSLTLKMKTKEYADMENLLETVKRAGVNGFDELKLRKETLESNIVDLKSKIKLFPFQHNTHSSRWDYDHFISPLSEIFQTLPSNADGVFSNEKIQAANNRKSELQERLSVLRGTKGRSEERHEHIMSAQHSKCPKCHYKWIPGVSDNELEHLVIKIAETTAEFNKLTEELDSVNSYIDRADEYLVIWRRFKLIADMNTDSYCKAFLDHLLEKDMLRLSPRNCLTVLYIWKDDMDLIGRINKLDDELINLQVAYEAASTIESLAGVGAFQDRVNAVVNDIETFTQDLNNIGNDKVTYKAVYDDTRKIMQLYADLEKEVDHLESLFDRYQRCVKNSIISNKVTELNSTLGQIQNQLNEKQTLESLIKDLTEDSIRLEEDIESCKILMEELSPVNGLIAEQLYGNIQCIVSQMNEIIAQVWTYDLEILSCGHESNELDYKFPFQIKASDITVPDIGKGSSAQIEIIDFAFKLVVMLYLELSNYPLFLDEPGVGFDEQHRTNFMNYIRLLIESKRHSQLILVSHYVSSYGAMQAEVCVLDGTNISTPMVHNQHVTMR